MEGGLYQRKGIYYEDTFAPRARYSSTRTSMALASMMKWDLHQMDVKRAFLNGMIEEEVYIEHQKGFESNTKLLMYVSWKRLYMD